MSPSLLSKRCTYKVCLLNKLDGFKIDDNIEIKQSATPKLWLPCIYQGNQCRCLVFPWWVQGDQSLSVPIRLHFTVIMTWTTFTTKRREKGRVAMTRMTEKSVNMTEHIPGPSSHPPATDLLILQYYCQSASHTMYIANNVATKFLKITIINSDGWMIWSIVRF